jgi:hypothetical protein
MIGQNLLRTLSIFALTVGILGLILNTFQSGDKASLWLVINCFVVISNGIYLTKINTKNPQG